MSFTISQALSSNKKGFHIGNRLILPFKAQPIKIICDKMIFTDFTKSKDIMIGQEPRNTSVYFQSLGRLRNQIGSHQVIKVILCEWDEDLSNIENHFKLICEIKENHNVVIHEPGADMLFIE